MGGLGLGYGWVAVRDGVYRVGQEGKDEGLGWGYGVGQEGLG